MSLWTPDLFGIGPGEGDRVMGAAENIKITTTKVLWKLGLYHPALRLSKFTSARAAALRGNIRNNWLRRKGASDGLPIPPPELIFDVAGTSDVKWFLEGGTLGGEGIQRALQKNGIDLLSIRKV